MVKILCCRTDAGLARYVLMRESRRPPPLHASPLSRRGMSGMSGMLPPSKASRLAA